MSCAEIFIMHAKRLIESINGPLPAEKRIAMSGTGKIQNSLRILILKQGFTLRAVNNLYVYSSQ